MRRLSVKSDNINHNCATNTYERDTKNEFSIYKIRGKSETSFLPPSDNRGTRVRGAVLFTGVSVILHLRFYDFRCQKLNETR